MHNTIAMTMTSLLSPLPPPSNPELRPDQVVSCDPSEVRGITLADFKESLKKIRRSVPQASLTCYEKWNATYGDISS